jgi:hypothetical protein
MPVSITFHFIIHIIVHIRYPFSYLFISYYHIHVSYFWCTVPFDSIRYVLLALTLNVFSYVFLGHCCYKSPPSASWTYCSAGWNLDRTISSICDGLFAFRPSYSGRTVDFTLPSIGHMVWYFDRSAEDINVPASSFKFRAGPLSNYIVLPIPHFEGVTYSYFWFLSRVKNFYCYSFQFLIVMSITSSSPSNF